RTGDALGARAARRERGAGQERRVAPALLVEGDRSRDGVVLPDREDTDLAGWRHLQDVVAASVGDVDVAVRPDRDAERVAVRHRLVRVVVALELAEIGDGLDLAVH